jgi:multidrug resistance efflux pump
VITQKQSRKARREEREARREMLRRQEAVWQPELDRLDAEAPALSQAVADAQAAVLAAEEELRLARAAASPLQQREGLAVRLGQVRFELLALDAEDEDDEL